MISTNEIGKESLLEMVGDATHIYYSCNERDGDVMVIKVDTSNESSVIINRVFLARQAFLNAPDVSLITYMCYSSLKHIQSDTGRWRRISNRRAKMIIKSSSMAPAP